MFVKSLSNGCPLLFEFTISNIRVSSQAVTYLVNHSTHLETLDLYACSLCDDGLVITKEADKLKCLKKLGLSINRKIADENIVNLVKGSHNLEKISEENFSLVTDDSLFSIAVNCPQLKTISVDFDGNK